MGKLTMINKIKNEKLIKQNQKGQIAIIILLVSAVVLTLGLSASRKTVTNTKIETDEESLKEAFNTAESAINNYLVDTSKTTYTTTGGGASVVSSSIGNAVSLSSGGQVLANSNQLFWLVDHDTNGNLGTNYYSNTSVNLSVDSGFSGALKIDYFYIDNTNAYQVKRLGCNYNNSNVVTGYTTDTSSCSIIDLSAGKPLLISVTPIGSATSLTISGSSNFPSQGEEITADSNTSSGVKTQVKTSYIYQLPSFFIDAITAKNIVQ